MKIRPRSLFLMVILTLLITIVAGCDDAPKSPEKVKNTVSKKLELRLSQEGSTPSQVATKYAVLISGSNEYRFEADLAVGYQVLLENDFSRENIYILNHDEEESYLHPTDGVAVESNVKEVFAHLKEKVTGQDLLFVYVTAHGERIQKEISDANGASIMLLSTLVMADGGQIDQKWFSSQLEGLNPKIGIFLFSTCFGGGFAEELGRKNFVSIAGSKSDKLGYSTLNNSFTGYFMLAFRDKSASDKNGDHRISMMEALEYAKQKHSFSRELRQEPFIKSDLDPASIFL